jgi:hypothetical protein
MRAEEKDALWFGRLREAIHNSGNLRLGDHRQRTVMFPSRRSARRHPANHRAAR